jgi:nucleotide-binding universal stress UspA family protein
MRYLSATNPFLPMSSPSLSLATDAHIMVPVDFSNHSLQALQAALEMLRLGEGGQLTLLSVVEPPTRGLRIQTDDLHRQMELEAERELQELARTLVAEGLKIHVGVVCGSPGEEICEQAARRGAKLIVISTHGHTGLKRYLLGSVAEKVVRHAHCPVLVLR